MHRLIALTVLVSLGPFRALASDEPASTDDVAAVEPSGPPLQIPLEWVVGEEAIQTEFFFYAPADRRNRFGVFTIGRLAVDLSEPSDSTSMLSSQLIANATSWMGIAAGANASPEGVSPFLGLSLFAQNPDRTATLNAFPAVLYNPGAANTDRWSTELLLLGSWTPRVNETWSVFTQGIVVLGMPLTFDEHLYSVGQLRLGPSYRDRLQFGVAADLELYGQGEALSARDNLGLFVRRVF